MPEGPAHPLVSRADFQIASAVMVPKRTGWKSLSTMLVLKRTSGCGGSGCGCLSFGMSRTVFPDSSHNIIQSQWPCLCFFGTKLQGCSDFPFHHQIGKFACYLGIIICIPRKLPSLNSLRSSTISPFSHSDDRRRRHAMCSCTLDLACGF